MESKLIRLKPSILFLALWASVIVLNIFGEVVPPLGKFLALVGFCVVWLAYPMVLVFASTVTKATSRLRGFVAANVAIFVVIFLLREFDNSMPDQWLSAIGILALLFVQFGAVRSLTRAEQHVGLTTNGGGFGAWLSLFFLPFFGIFFIHKRHRRLVENKPNPPLNWTHAG